MSATSPTSKMITITIAMASMLFMEALNGPAEESESGCGFVDQAPLCQAHCVVEVAIGKAPATEPQPSNHPLKKDAALFRRHRMGRLPDDPKLRIR